MTNLNPDPLAGDVTTSYLYDGLGNLIQTTGPDLSVIEIDYDSLSRKFWMRDPDLGEWRYQYDGRGNLKCRVDIGGQDGGGRGWRLDD